MKANYSVENCIAFYISVLCCVLYGWQHGSSEGNQGLCYSFLGRVASAITRLVGLYKARCSIARCTKQLSKLTKECAPLSAPASNTSGDRCQSGKQHVWCAIVSQIAATETLKSGADLKKATLPLDGSNANKQQMPAQCSQCWMLILPRTKKWTTHILLSKTAGQTAQYSGALLQHSFPSNFRS